MWLPNSDELQYFKHYERDLANDVKRQKIAVPTRILAARPRPYTSNPLGWLGRFFGPRDRTNPDIRIVDPGGAK